MIIFVSFPRLSRRAWKVALPVALLTAAALIPAVLTELPTPMESVANWAWLGQAAIRLFLLLTAALVLGPVVSVSGMQLMRNLRRSRIRRTLDPLRITLKPLLLCTAGLTALGSLANLAGLAPTPYLARLPSLLTGAELGTVFPTVDPLAALGMVCYNLIRSEVAARGLLVAILLFLFGKKRWSPHAAVVGAALLWTLLAGGSMEPAPLQMALLAGQGILLGWLRLKNGIDGAIVSHALSILLIGALM